MYTIQVSFKSLCQTFTILATIHPDLSKTIKSRFIGIEIQQQLVCLSNVLRCLHDILTAQLRFMTAALRFTMVELRMLTMRSRFATVLVWFKPVSAMTSCCILDESGWIGMSVIPRIIPNAHEWPRLHLRCHLI